MIKSELVQRISAQNPHLHHRDVEKIVHTAAMARGDRIELRGFGSFGVKNGPRRMTLIQHAVATMGRTAPLG